MPEFNPVTVIVADLMRKLEATPFEPFSIVMSNGRRYDVMHPEQVIVTRVLRRIEWETMEPEPRVADINPLHIATLETLQSAA